MAAMQVATGNRMDMRQAGGYAASAAPSQGFHQPQQWQQPQMLPPQQPAFNLDEIYRGEPYVAHEMPNYGPRTATWTTVRVPEENYGVVINAEYPGHVPRAVDGRPEVMYFYDQAIRNEGWQRIGQRMPRVHRPGEESISSWLHHHADYAGAVDVKGELKMERMSRPRCERAGIGFDYHLQHSQRNPDGIERVAAKVEDRLGREIVTADEVQRFFADPEAIAYDTLT
mmetsp:Transcript_79538/g.177875  ORF Transcript_79538/g.177875 Transcript_79538/m.177875 type:complete len:227 (-) Transcript_79538:62-742(-)